MNTQDKVIAASVMDSPEVDVAIIGSGLSGIAFARFYLDTHPESKLIILEGDESIGGVWGASRVFDAFWVQSPIRMSSFSDCPMELPADAPKVQDTFPAKYVSEYLEKYVANHIYDGKSLRSRIQLRSKVLNVKRISSGWILHIEGDVNIRCRKLAVASGLTSEPVMPMIPQMHNLLAPLFHHREFGTHSKRILAASSGYTNVTVLGGGKSAADMVYASLKAGKAVNWIIRRTGEGPGIFQNPASNGRYRNTAEKNATQTASLLNPSAFHLMPEWAQFLHQSASKKEGLESRLFAPDHRSKEWVNYKGREGALPCFGRLEPRASWFWGSGPVGMIQHVDFWDLISQQAHVHRADPSGTTANAIILDDGTQVPTDVLLCGTGWSPHYTFFSPEQMAELGLPHLSPNDQSWEEQNWSDLMKAADDEITKQYPILAQPPPNCHPKYDAHLTPARLYQGIAPLTDSSIVFLGRCRQSNNFLSAEAQAMWATAYWDGHVTVPPYQQGLREVAYMNALSRRRYPTRGVDGINFYTDLIWYTDKLACEAGLTSHRKDWWDDPDAPMLVDDLKDCKDEYIAKYGNNEASMAHLLSV